MWESKKRKNVYHKMAELMLVGKSHRDEERQDKDLYT